MTKQYGIITLYVIATVALLIVACAKQDTISIHFPDLDIEGMPEIDTAQGDEAVEGDLLDGDEQ